jgi:hypothetical protein
MPKVVQFGHSGGEHIVNYIKGRESNPGIDFHSYDRQQVRDEGIMPWNDGAHFRKFMKAPGRYVKNLSSELSEECNITFWGEWEPATPFSTITYPNSKPADNLIEKIRSKGRPQFLHEVYKLKKETGDYLQNTDPCVFGENFYYTNCKMTGQMRQLNKGDIILFGTSGKKDKETGTKYMELDTVFVIADKVEITKKDYPAFKDFSDEKYEYFRNSVLEKIFERKSKRLGNYYVIDDSKKFIIYKGATYDCPVNGMYSFVPCKNYSNNQNEYAFGKVVLIEDQFKDIMNVTLNSAATPAFNNKRRPILECYREYAKFKGSDESLATSFWELIARTVLEQECYLGVELKAPKIVP